MKQDERDMLIKVCGTVESLKEHQVEMDLKIQHHMDNVDNKVANKINFGTFKWIVGGLATLILTGFLALGSLTLDSIMDLTETNHLLKDHIGFAAIVYKQVTGEDWGTASAIEMNRARDKVLKERDQREQIEAAHNE